MSTVKKKTAAEVQEIDIRDTQDRLVIDKIYVLKAVMCGQMATPSSIPGSEETYRPIMDDHHAEFIRDKIMELIQKL